MIKGFTLRLTLLICMAVLLITASCNQRFRFRKKVTKEVPDSTETEKEYRIAW